VSRAGHSDRQGRGVDIDAADAERSRVAVIQFIDAAVMGFDADPRRVYRPGFSHGATLADSIGLTAAAGVRGIIAVGGRVWPAIAARAAPVAALRRLTLLIQQRRNDPVMPPGHVPATRDRFADLRRVARLSRVRDSRPRTAPRDDGRCLRVPGHPGRPVRGRVPHMPTRIPGGAPAVAGRIRSE